MKKNYNNYTEEELKEIVDKDSTNIEAKAALCMKYAKKRLTELGVDFVCDEKHLQENLTEKEDCEYDEV